MSEVNISVVTPSGLTATVGKVSAVWEDGMGLTPGATVFVCVPLWAKFTGRIYAAHLFVCSPHTSVWMPLLEVCARRQTRPVGKWVRGQPTHTFALLGARWLARPRLLLEVIFPPHVLFSWKEVGVLEANSTRGKAASPFDHPFLTTHSSSSSVMWSRKTFWRKWISNF